jgi:hypothetical protein
MTIMFGDDNKYRAIPLKPPEPAEPLDWVDVTIDQAGEKIRLSFDDGTYVRSLNLVEAVGLLMYLQRAIGRMPAPSSMAATSPVSTSPP